MKRTQNAAFFEGQRIKLDVAFRKAQPLFTIIPICF